MGSRSQGNLATSFPGSLFSASLGRWKKDPGRNPFNQNFRAEVRKFLGVEWIATGPKRSRSIPLAKRVSP